jgi:hypothetical protein
VVNGVVVEDFARLEPALGTLAAAYAASRCTSGSATGRSDG